MYFHYPFVLKMHHYQNVLIWHSLPRPFLSFLCDIGTFGDASHIDGWKRRTKQTLNGVGDGAGGTGTNCMDKIIPIARKKQENKKCENR
jgi:hypothetical protein